MSSRLTTTPPSSARRLLATAALAAVLAFGVSMSAPAGAASAAPAAPTSHSAAQADPIAASQAGIVNREFHISSRTVARLAAGTLSPQALAGLICTQFHSGIACAKLVTYVLQGYPGVTDPRTCARGEGFIVAYPNTYQSRCGG
ncbi:hypothetical protein [Clavibacter sp. Sh2088]|uniref:hypothetical protein n=1 Tax=Clavibacter sp. Sh2088 TaxID=3397676 RepID=UPI0039DF6069